MSNILFTFIVAKLKKIVNTILNIYLFFSINVRHLSTSTPSSGSLRITISYNSKETRIVLSIFDDLQNGYIVNSTLQIQGICHTFASPKLYSYPSNLHIAL